MDTKIEESGFLLVDKPVDWTSHDAVAYIRSMVRAHAREFGSTVKPKNIRVGHAGTLDPFASGLLIIGVGRDATKRIDEFVGMPKEYVATVRLGATTDTQDLTGTITPYIATNNNPITEETIAEVVASFVGKQQQIPPMYSAKKVKGKKLYELARAGVVIERAPVDIEIYDIELLPQPRGSRHESERVTEGVCDNDISAFTIRITCSKGTYIRTLANDMGEKLGVGAYCEALRRTKIGDYSVDGAIGPKEFEKGTWTERLLPSE